MTNPADIARALSEAQRRKLIELENGQPREFSLGLPGLALVDNGLAFVNELGARHLTDFGHAVLKHVPRPTASDASTDRTPATVDGCGRKVEENERR